jgi:hypothetical protein
MIGHTGMRQIHEAIMGNESRHGIVSDFALSQQMLRYQCHVNQLPTTIPHPSSCSSNFLNRMDSIAYMDTTMSKATLSIVDDKRTPKELFKDGITVPHIRIRTVISAPRPRIP